VAIAPALERTDTSAGETDLTPQDEYEQQARSPARPSVIVVSPHLDDAALSTFAYLQSAVGVVNVFTAPPQDSRTVSLWDHVCGYASSTDVNEKRKWEDEAALAAVGIRPLNLDFAPDSSIRQAEGTLEPVAPALAGILYETLVSDWIMERLASFDLFVPLAGGPKPNPDHVICRDAALILHRLGRARVTLYADQPYVYKNRAWPMFVTGESKPADASWWWRFPRAVPDMIALDHNIEVVRLDEYQRESKRQLMMRYETQYWNLNRRLRTRGLLLDPDLYGIEVYWKLDPPARTDAA
jgi:LmbE family N-acetylglucosaminyl deacetylase